MKKLLALALSMTLTAGVLTACGKEEPSSDPGAQTPSQTALQGKVSTNGSTSVEKVMGALIESFREVEPGITVTYDPTGSGAGLEAASNGTADIGLSSRGLKDSEKENLTEIVVARDGIAVVVHPDNPVENLTVEEIASIAKGEITDWAQVGGGQEKIAFIGREAGSGTRGAFEELTETTDQCQYTQELTSTGAVIAAVSTTPGAIGYVSLSAVEDGVRSVQVGGVPCSEETVLDGSYPIQRPFVFAVKTDEPLSEAAQAFVDFATDPANGELYAAAGVVPAFGE